MRQNIKKKLRGSAGETITETLVALLVAALALVMLAGALTTAFRLITKSTGDLKTYYSEVNSVVNMTNKKDGSVTIESESGDLKISQPISYSTSSKYPLVVYQLKTTP